MHAHEMHAHETLAHHCFGGSLAQTVVDLLRSEFQNMRFCGVVPIALRRRRSSRQRLYSRNPSFTENGGAYLSFQPRLLISQISEQDSIETGWRTMAEIGRWKIMFGSRIGA
jgi:hypothetical protein